MITERLHEYFKYKGLSFYVVEKTLQVSTGSISGAVKYKRNIGSKVLQKVLLIYSDLSAEWLLRGTGGMLLDEDSADHEKGANYGAMSDNWLIDKTLSLFNMKSKNDLISFFERIHGTKTKSDSPEKTDDPFERIVLEIIEKKYGSTLANADELYAMYLQQLMREGEDMLNDGTDEIRKSR